jgi:hypothetical protein
MIVGAYRRRFPRIPGAWRTLGDALPRMAYDPLFGQDFGPVRLRHQEIILPNGLKLFYRDLQKQVNDKTGKAEWVFWYGKKMKRAFGGKVFENIVQALARIITMNAAVRMRRHFPHNPLAHQVHDDLVYVVPNDVVPEFRVALREEMSLARDWYATLPLAAEDGAGPNYGDAK